MAAAADGEAAAATAAPAAEAAAPQADDGVGSPDGRTRGTRECASMGALRREATASREVCRWTEGVGGCASKADGTAKRVVGARPTGKLVHRAA